MMNSSQGKKESTGIVGVFMELFNNRSLYLMMVPAVVIVFLLAYLPMPGIILAFKDFNFQQGIYGSPWAGLKNFKFFFTSEYAVRITVNTLWLNFNYLFWTTFINVTFAILLNELGGKYLVRIYQNIMFLPFFISIVVVGQIINLIMFSNSDNGAANQILSLFGLEPVKWLNSPGPWVKILVGIKIWLGTGYGVIVYLATITGIDAELYEAAGLDGAGRMRRIWHITLPMLMPAIVMLTLMSVGKIMYGDFGLIWAIIQDQYTMLYQRLDIIETYVYRAVMKNVDFGTSSAIGLFQSLVGFLMVMGANLVAKKIDKDYALF